MPYRLHRTFAALLFMVGGAGRVFAQPPVILKSIEQKDLPFITEYTHYLKTGKRVSIDAVLKEDSGHKFKPLNEKELVDLNFTKDCYWFKFRIRSKEVKSGRYFLVINNPIIREAALFRFDDKGVSFLGTTGSTVPFVNRPYVSNFYTYAIDVNPETDAVYYLFVGNQWQTGIFALSWYTEQKFKRLQDQVYFSIGVLTGIILLTVLINLALFIFLRDTLHFTYGFYALSAILLLMAMSNIDSQFLFPKLSSWNQVSRVTSAGIYVFLFLKVMRRFLNQKPSNSRYFLLTSIMMYLSTAIPAINLIVTFYNSNATLKQTNWWLWLFFVTATFTVAMLSCIEKLRQGFKPALFYLVAISAPLVAGAVMAFYLSDLKPKDLHPLTWLFWQPSPFDFSLGLEAVIICTGILYRYYLYKKDKETLALALEKEKTTSAEQVLLTQEEERRRIAEDLHDELGGNLAALKMMLQSYKLPEAKAHSLIRLIDKASTNARNISHNLMPPEFENTNLADLVHQHCQRLNKEGETAFHFHCSGTKQRLDKHKELMLYRIVLELTNNVVKHAKATEATVQLLYYENHLEIMAEDDGSGFSANAPDGIGLKNIRSRVNYLKGKLHIDSGAGGTTVMIQVPFQTS